MDALLHALRPLFAPAFTLWGRPPPGWSSWPSCSRWRWSAATCASTRSPGRWPSPARCCTSCSSGDSKLYGEAGLQIVFVVVARLGLVAMAARHAGRRRGAARAPPAAARRARLCRRAGARLAGAGAASSTTAPTPTCPGSTPSPRRPASSASGCSAASTSRTGRSGCVVNVVSVGLFAVKGLWLTVLLYAVFAVLSVVGWRAWRSAGRGAMSRAFVVALLGAESTGKTHAGARLWRARWQRSGPARGHGAGVPARVVRPRGPHAAHRRAARHRRRADAAHRRRRGRPRRRRRRHHAR